MFGHLVDISGAVELDQVHRFHHHWERQASLRLRAGDPRVLTEYEARGRLHGGAPQEMEAEIITAWEQARHRGETVALMANSTDTVARLNRLAQHARILSGELDANAPSMRIGDEWMLEGDEVVTRRNDRTLRTDRGLMIKNRDHWTITTIHPDHSVTVTGRTGTTRLPAQYVAEDLPMTRGRDSNHAYVVVEDNQTAHDVLTQAITRDWIDQPAVVRKAQLDPHHTRQQEPAVLGEDDEVDKLEERVHRLIEERRRARAREAERTAGRGLEMDIN